jgi:hypothetical protein
VSACKQRSDVDDVCRAVVTLQVDERLVGCAKLLALFAV